METTKVLTGRSNIFYNADCLVVEYDDVLRMPQFALLCGIEPSNLGELSQILDFTEIEGYSMEALGEWYFARKYKNIYMNFPTDMMEGEAWALFCEKLLEAHLSSSELFFGDVTKLSFYTVLSEIREHKSLLHDIVIYNDYRSPYIDADVEKNFSGAKLEYADIEKALAACPKDSTFVFSNIENVLVLEELGKLDYSSIIISNGFRYNYDENTELKVDLEKLLNEHVFKIDFFDPFGNQ